MQVLYKRMPMGKILYHRAYLVSCSLKQVGHIHCDSHRSVAGNFAMAGPKCHHVSMYLGWGEGQILSQCRKQKKTVFPECVVTWFSILTHPACTA